VGFESGGVRMVEVLTKVVKKGDEGGRVDVMLFTYCLEGVGSYMRNIVWQYLSYDKDGWVARGSPNGESFHWK